MMREGREGREGRREDRGERREGRREKGEGRGEERGGEGAGHRTFFKGVLPGVGRQDVASFKPGKQKIKKGNTQSKHIFLHVIFFL
jgi:hypothetical protein